MEHGHHAPGSQHPCGPHHCNRRSSLALFYGKDDFRYLNLARFVAGTLKRVLQPRFLSSTRFIVSEDNILLYCVKNPKEYDS